VSDGIGLPGSLRRNIDLFEIGFVFLFLPLVVSTMDQPPLHLGALMLLWIFSWFLLRAQTTLPAELLAKWKAFPIPSRAMWLAGLAVFGGCWSAVFPHGQHALRAVAAGAFLVPARALLFSLPLFAIGFEYVPRRFRSRGWIPEPIVPFLPAALFAALHIATGSWAACALAFLGGWLWLKRRLPLWLGAFAHASIGWAGISLGLW
jgi:hypothetical protein